MMKGLHAEINNLRADLKTEKQQRQAEAKRHEEQLGWLRDALARERSERNAAFETIRTLLSEESTRSKTETQDVRTDLSMALKQRTEARDFQALNYRVTELAQMIEEEVRAREKKCSRLDDLIAANTMADTHFAKHTLQELAVTQELIEDNTASDRHFQEAIMPRMVLAGKLLQAGDKRGPAVPGASAAEASGGPIVEGEGEHAAAATAAAAAVAAVSAVAFARAEEARGGRAL